MTPKSRSRITNKPPANSPTRSAQATARRVRDLYEGYLARVGPGPHDAIVEAAALRAAELATICEGLRARALAGENIDVNAITRLMSTLDRAERALVKGAAVADDPDEWGKMMDEIERRDEERRLANLANRETER
jgi:hypothetical protein